MTRIEVKGLLYVEICLETSKDHDIRQKELPLFDTVLNEHLLFIAGEVYSRLVSGVPPVSVAKVM